MNNLHDHYGLLLGLDESWKVADVDLFVEEKRVEIELKYVGKDVNCPDCNKRVGLPITLQNDAGGTWIRCSSKLRSVREFRDQLVTSAAIKRSRFLGLVSTLALH